MKSTPAARRDPSAGRTSDFDRRSLAIVAAVAALVMAIGLGSTRLWDEDEGYFASTAAEMYERGDWIVPTFNHELFGHKPPLMYWGMMAGFKAFGVNEFGARFVSALFGIATALMTCVIGTRLFNPRVGCLAGIVMGSSVMFSVVARAATPDAHLTFFAVAALYLFVRHGGLERRCTWLGWAACYAAMAGGVLAKGPIGILFPMAVIGLYLLMTTPIAPGTTSWRSAAWQKFGEINFVNTIAQMRPITAILVTLAIAGPWFYLVEQQSGGKFLAEFFGTHHFQRATSAMDNHSGPIYYYIITCSLGLFPWSVFAVPSLLEWVRGMRERNHQNFNSLLLIGSWAGVYLVIFSIARTKLPNYVLPAYPALALGLAFYLDSWLRAPQQVNRFLLRGSFGTLIFGGLATSVGMLLAGRQLLGGHTLLDLAHVPWELQQQAFWLSIVGVPAILGGTAAWLLSERAKHERACQVLVVAAVATLMLLWNFAAPIVDRYQSPQTIAAHLQQQSSSPIRIVALGCFRPSMIYYAGQKIDCRDKPEEASFAFLMDDATFLITTTGHYNDLIEDKLLPAAGEVEIIERLPGFPSGEELVVVAKRQTMERIAAEKELRLQR